MKITLTAVEVTKDKGVMVILRGEEVTKRADEIKAIRNSIVDAECPTSAGSSVGEHVTSWEIRLRPAVAGLRRDKAEAVQPARLPLQGRIARSMQGVRGQKSRATAECAVRSRAGYSIATARSSIV